MQSHRPLILAAVAVAAMSAFGGGPSAEPQAKPLPVIRRSDNPPKTPFDRPPLIVLGSVFEQRTVVVGRVVTDAIGEADAPTKLERLYRLSLLVLRVNERLPSEPDLEGRRDFLLRDDARDPLKLQFGRQYILFVKFAKVLAGLPWLKSDLDPPPYEIATPDAGFEIVGKNLPTSTVRVLRRGDALASYDAKPLDEVFRLITGQTFLEWEPKYRR